MSSTSMIFKLFSLLFLTALCLAATVTQKTDGQKAVWWEGDYSGGSDLASMKAAVKQAYEEMATDAKAKNVARVPGTMGLIWTKNGGMFQSSVKGVQASGHQIVEECSDNQHRYQGNCAEVWALFTAEQNGWDLNSALLAVYGVMNAEGKTGFMSPCSDKNGKKGCATVLKSSKYKGLEVQCVTRNGMVKRGELPTSPLDGESEWEDIESESEPTISKRTTHKKTTSTKKSGTKKSGTKKAHGTKSTTKKGKKGKKGSSDSCSLAGHGVVELMSKTAHKSTKGTKGTKGTKKSGTKKTGATA